MAGLLLVISGPSGVGKTSICRAVEERLDGVFSVSATTRPAAEGEVHGRDYIFVSPGEFTQMVADSKFLEHAQVFGRHAYGTPREPVQAMLDQDRLVMLDIDVQGALQIRNTMPDAFMLFILPPSEEELLRRLRDRGRDDEEAIQRRFNEARNEIETARRTGVYDAMLVNDDLDVAIERAVALIEERMAKSS